MDRKYISVACVFCRELVTPEMCAECIAQFNNKMSQTENVCYNDPRN